MRKFMIRILDDAVERLYSYADIVKESSNDELKSAERLPGNLKGRSKYDKMINNAERLDIASKQIQHAASNILDILNL